jgi:glycosyltransferase involved in cell wall biosynthesis
MINDPVTTRTKIVDDNDIVLLDESQNKSKTKVAYIVSRFPKITETFILYEILAMEKQGNQVEIYPLLRARNTATHPEGASMLQKLVERARTQEDSPVLMHPEAVPLVERANYHPFLSWPIFRAHLSYLRRKPGAYLGTLWTLLRANFGSINYFIGALGIFPKALYFAKLMEAAGITHIHAHFANHPAAAAFVIHSVTGIPYSFTAHGADLQVDQHMLCEKTAEADTVITISRYNKEFIIDKCGEQARDKVAVIYCGVDTGVFQPRSINKYHESGPLDILCIGTMYEVKGHMYLLKACRLLQERGIDFECNLVGDGPFKEVLKAQVTQSGLADKIHFRGQQTRTQIAEWLQRADVLSVPSIPTTSGRREGIPVVLMEAMSSSVPVVASDISGIPELVENEVSGLLVPPRDPKAIADAMERLHDDPTLRQRLGQAGRDKVVREFDLYTNAASLSRNFN